MAINSQGYGHAVLHGTLRKTHRVAFELRNGPIPEGMHVLHTCDCPSCVNPHHLWLGSHPANIPSATRKGHMGPKGRKRAA